MKVVWYWLFLLLPINVFSQTGTISGKVKSTKGEHLGFASVQLRGTSIGTTAGPEGEFLIKGIPYGKYSLLVSFTGFKLFEKNISLQENSPHLSESIELEEAFWSLDQVVITATKTEKKQTESPVIVNVIHQNALQNVQACNLSDGLKFQPGLRVETDCQTCNYTQLRMNGLGGGYSQILINGRPVFSPLTGLYGMEQLPANMVERIEVVRGGGSSLYGTSAIGGTVNVITKLPKENNFEVGYTFQQVNQQTPDHIISGNGTLLNPSENAGISVFLNLRKRDMYDHNADNFSELPELKNTSFGANLFFKPTDQQKLEISISNLNEYRYGGEMSSQPAHLAQQAEEREHNVWIGNADYQWNFNHGNSSFIGYLAGQHTDRTHYTGILPDQENGLESHLSFPPYGISKNSTFQYGLQFNHRFGNFLGGSNVITLGAEYNLDEVMDVIETYDYTIDQTTKNKGGFLQSDWELIPSFSLLSGVRVDRHNLVDRVIVSPRFSMLYKLQNTTQLRFTWSTGFRAPQAFDTDMHLAFAGGGVSRISLAKGLEEERSQSISASVNYDKSSESFIYGFTLEGFHTKLHNAFYLHPIGEDEFGERFEKRNGEGAIVQGITLEIRGNYRQKVQLEAGATLQISQFDEPVENLKGLPAKRAFLRTPNDYGYATLSYMPGPKWNASVNYVYTGTMGLVHFAGAPEQSADEYKRSPGFHEFGGKISYTFPFGESKKRLELFGGIKNILNAYQNDFDSGKNRDSNYVYGPATPRTIFAGLKLKSI